MHSLHKLEPLKISRKFSLHKPACVPGRMLSEMRQEKRILHSCGIVTIQRKAL
jgi:hypothetical protein